jgi:hypothetical protein
MALQQTFKNLQIAIAKGAGQGGGNLTDRELAEALREIGNFIGLTTQPTNNLVLDTAASPTDAVVQASLGGVEVYDGMEVYVRSASNNAQLKKWRRHAGAWLAVVAGP